MRVRIPSLPHDHRWWGPFYTRPPTFREPIGFIKHRLFTRVVFTTRDISASSHSSQIFPTASNRSSCPLSLPVCGSATIMLVPLLPASAAPFAPRASSVSVVLGWKVEPWLTKTLKRINREEQRRDNREEQHRDNRVKQRRFNSVPQHQRYLTETLSSPNAIWTLTSIMLPKTLEADFKRDANNPLLEAMMNYEIIHIKGYVVCVDMVLRNEVIYKLTKDTIDTLIEHHKEVCCVAAAGPDGEQRCKKLHEKFVQAINKLVIRTHVSILEGLEEGGTGKLINGESDEVKREILSLMEQGFPMDNVWSQPGMQSSQPAFELWRVPPSSSSVVSPASTDDGIVWVPMAQKNSPQETALISAMPMSGMSAVSQCGVSMAMAGMGGSYSFDWDEYQECAATHVFTIPQDNSFSSVVVSPTKCAPFPSFMPKALD
ncbi:hypothetical protein LRP88_14894 [Fusarium phalaenopsidis]